MIRYFLALVACALLLVGCSKKDDPAMVVSDFILLIESGKIDEASRLLTKDNQLDYFDKFKHLGKDMMFIDYDYKGNDDVLDLKFEKDSKNCNDEICLVKLTTNYKLQNHSFQKDIILHKIDGEWKIYKYNFMPVVVK
ncbi:MAG: hypothetical protein MR902_02725 [Campylobacter sp.]|nr:hypothetical protein [Campylobacter sp.]